MHARAAPALALLSALACGRGGGDGGAGGGRQAGSPAQRPPVPVQVARAEQRDVPRTLAAVGTIEPSNQVGVRPLVTGAIVGVFFRDGQEVRAGERLFQIDPRPYRAALDQALASLAHGRRQASNAAADARRYGTLVRSGYVAKQQYDTAVATARTLQADVAAYQAAVEKARIDLADCDILAPTSGRTGAVLVQRGNVVQANQTAPLVVISTLRPVYVDFSVPEQYVGELRQGLGRMQVDVTEAGAARQGTLTFLNNAVDTASGTILARATFPNQDEALWPGAFVDVRVVLGVLRGAVVVPPSAVVQAQDGPSVFVVRPDRTVAQQPVQLAQANTQAAVVTRGLAAGAEVVTDGQLNLTPGARVAPRAPQAGSQAAGAAQAGGPTGRGATGSGSAEAQAGTGGAPGRASADPPRSRP